MKRVVCILSSNYSGSHYLSLVLGSHSHAIHLGEVKNYVKETPRECYACGDVESCALFRGIDEVPVRALYDLFFERAGNGISCLIDNSKKPFWFENMVGIPGIELKIIHLVRDPRALMRRWLMNYDSRKLEWRQRWRQFRYWHGKPSMLFSGSMLTTYIHKWISQNRDIRRFIERHSLDHRTVLYRELALHADQTVAPLMHWLDLEFEPGQIEYWNFPHHGTQKEEYEWVKTQGVTGYIDLRWQEFLSGDDRRRVEEHPLLLSFLDSLGTRFGPDGLYRTSDDPAPGAASASS